MAKILKPPSTYDADDIDTGGEWYDGPPPKPGFYNGTVKKMLLSKVGDEQRIMVLCEINSGPYKGAGVVKWLQLTKQGSPWVNQFLHSLTDGSEEQKKAIRIAFRDYGYTVGDVDAKKRLPIIKIGKKTDPIGRATAFMVKLRTGTDDVERAEISRFVVPKVDNQEPEEDDDIFEQDNALDDEPDLGGIDEFVNPAEGNEDDDTDPWS